MTQVANLIQAFERGLVQQDQRLRSSSSHWVKSGEVRAPGTVLHALDALHADLLDFEQRAAQLKPDNDSERRARELLIESLNKEALGIQTLRLAASTTDPSAQTGGLQQAERLIKSAHTLFTEARNAAGCGKQC